MILSVFGLLLPGFRTPLLAVSLVGCGILCYRPIREEAAEETILPPANLAALTLASRSDSPSGPASGGLPKSLSEQAKAELQPLTAPPASPAMAEETTPSLVLRARQFPPRPTGRLKLEDLSLFLIQSLWVTEFPGLYQAISLGLRDQAFDLMRGGMGPEDTTPAGDRALTLAVRVGDAESVRHLLWFGADIQAVGRENQRPLGLATLRRSQEVLPVLLAGGADPNQPFVAPVQPELMEALPIKDLKYWLRFDTGVTPLMACAARGDVEAAAVLIRNGAKPSVCTKKHKRYPINFAATQGYLFLMRVLLGRSPDEGPELLVTVDLSQQPAWITRRGKVIDSTRVSSGRSGFETPAGRYVVTDKHRHHTSTIYKVDMPWFMRLNCGAIGLHSGHVTGRPASHGCVRLPYNKARDFFSKVTVGDEVQVVR